MLGGGWWVWIKILSERAPSARAPLPVLPEGQQLGKVPYRARFRSDKHAAVLRLQNTQPKDRRVYTALTGILTEPQALWKDRKGNPGRRSRSLRIIIHTLEDLLLFTNHTRPVRHETQD